MNIEEAKKIIKEYNPKDALSILIECLVDCGAVVEDLRKATAIIKGDCVIIIDFYNQTILSGKICVRIFETRPFRDYTPEEVILLLARIIEENKHE